MEVYSLKESDFMEENATGFSIDSSLELLAQVINVHRNNEQEEEEVE